VVVVVVFVVIIIVVVFFGVVVVERALAAAEAQGRELCFIVVGRVGVPSCLDDLSGDLVDQLSAFVASRGGGSLLQLLRLRCSRQVLRCRLSLQLFQRDAASLGPSGDAWPCRCLAWRA
jgi:hypothetical protein